MITRDIVLAARLVERGALVLNDSGERYDAENVRERRSLRDFSYELRAAGITTPGPRQYGRRQIAAFANRFDREIVKSLNRK